jgi:hypothetical protein
MSTILEINPLEGVDLDSALPCGCSNPHPEMCKNPSSVRVSLYCTSCYGTGLIFVCDSCYADIKQGRIGHSTCPMTKTLIANIKFLGEM